MKPNYCTQNNGECSTCSLSNYGRDCRNNKISPHPDDIRESRLSLGLTQAQAGELVGATRRTWQNWELGTRKMPKGMLELWTMKTKGVME